MSPNQRRAGARQHNIWIDDTTWAAVKAKAAVEGTDASALIRQFLEQYVGQTPTENHPK